MGCSVFGCRHPCGRMPTQMPTGTLTCIPVQTSTKTDTCMHARTDTRPHGRPRGRTYRQRPAHAQSVEGADAERPTVGSTHGWTCGRTEGWMEGRMSRLIALPTLMLFFCGWLCAPQLDATSSVDETSESKSSNPSSSSVAFVLWLKKLLSVTSSRLVFPDIDGPH